jgi:hypothetical protein
VAFDKRLAEELAMLRCSDFHARYSAIFVDALLRLIAPFGRSRQETD